MRALLVTLLVLLAGAPAAHADTIVFRRGTDVWRMAPDGSGQTPLTGGERRYEWPSAADDGTIVASDETGRLWRMTLDGVSLGGPIPTAATVATEDAPAEPSTHVRVSPDGARIAYDQVIDGDPDHALDAGLRDRPRLPRPGGGPAVPGRAVVDRQRPPAAEPGRGRPGPRRRLLALRHRRRRRDGRPVVQRRHRDVGDRLRCRRLALGHADRGARRRRGRPRQGRRRGSCCGCSPSTAGRRRCVASSRSRLPTPTARPARPSRPTAPGSPGPRATGSTSPRSAR